MITPFQSGDELVLSSFAADIFEHFIESDYKPEGVSAFRTYIHPEQFLKRVKQGRLIFLGRILGQLAGMLELSNPEHVSLFLVDEKYQPLGVGKKLLQQAMESSGSTSDRIHMNAAPGFVSYYQKLGFEITNEKQEKNGIVYVPMVIVV